MTKQEITDKVFKIICKKFKIRKREINSESTFNNLGLNLFNKAYIIFRIEEKFKMEFPDNLNEFGTLDSVVDYIYKTINKR